MTDEELRLFATWLIREAVDDAAGDYIGLFEAYETYNVLLRREGTELSEDDADKVRDTLLDAKLSVTWDE